MGQACKVWASSSMCRERKLRTKSMGHACQWLLTKQSTAWKADVAKRETFKRKQKQSMTKRTEDQKSISAKPACFPMH
eukprot:4785148-Amphidinium_carterae.1